MKDEEPEDKPKSVVQIGEIILTSWVESSDSLIAKVEKILQNKTFKEYLGLIEQKKIAKSYTG